MGGRAARKGGRARAQALSMKPLCAQIIATNFGRAAAEKNFSTTNYEAIFFVSYNTF